MMKRNFRNIAVALASLAALALSWAMYSSNWFGWFDVPPVTDMPSRNALQVLRDGYFNGLLFFTALVALGVLMEGPELVIDIWELFTKKSCEYKNLLLPSLDRREAPSHHGIKIVATIGWLLILIGVAGEGIEEARISPADRALKVFDDALVIDAEQSAKTAKAEVQDLVKQADALRKRIAELSPRNLDIKQQDEIVNNLKPRFWGHPTTVQSYGMDGEGTALATELISVLHRSTGVPIGDGRANTIVSGWFEMGIAIRGPSSEMPFMLALKQQLVSIGKLRSVEINGLTGITGATIGGRAVMGGRASIGGGGMGQLVRPQIPANGPVTVFVGIRPPTVAPNSNE